MEEPEIRVYYVTDKAYNGLITLAQKYGYIQYGSDRRKGISNFLNKLASTDFIDTRPAIVKERHVQEVRNNRAPTWKYQSSRRARPLKLTDHAIACYLKVAFIYEIVRAVPYAVGGPGLRTPYPAVAYVLEGIGLNWLTPETIPYNDNN